MENRTNKILTIPEPGKVEVIERPFPKIKGGYLIVKNEYSALCLEGTRIYTSHDFEKFQGGLQSDYWDGLGHESVGVVEEVSPGSNFKKGDRVIIFQGDHCGCCYSCENGLSPTYCDSNMVEREGVHGVAMEGIQNYNESESGGWALAQYRIAPEANVFKIPDELDFKYAATANCSIGVGYSNQELMAVKAGDTMLVGGIGFIAMGHIAAAMYRGVKVIALIRNPIRKKILENMGVEHFVSPEDTNWEEQVRALTFRGQGVDHAVDCSGVPYYQEKLLEVTRLYANVNFSGHTPGAALNFKPLDHLIHKAHHFTGQHDVRKIDREGLVKCLMDTKVQKMIDAFVTVFPMTEAKAALELQVSKKCGKILLKPQE